MPKTVQFAAIDGEGHDGKYTLLGGYSEKWGYHSIYNPNGLSTQECLTFLEDGIFPYDNRDKYARIGYGLSYDFEMMLRDLTDDEYMVLRQDLLVPITTPPRPVKQTTKAAVKWVPGHFLDYCSRYTGVYRKPVAGGGWEGDWWLRTNDMFPYYQTSFEKAMAAWLGPNDPDAVIIAEGKKARGSAAFAAWDRKTLERYNAAELRVLVKLANLLQQAFVDGFTAVGLPDINYDTDCWYGPGSQAEKFYAATKFSDQHPRFRGGDFDAMVADVDSRCLAAPRNSKEPERPDPMMACFFGGRIESCQQGRYVGPLYDYDQNSAYPYALTRVPRWKESDVRRAEVADLPMRELGMWFCEWDFREKLDFYPFPFRTATEEVVFPPMGAGWVTSPELWAVADTLGLADVKISHGWVLRNTEGMGDGQKPLPLARQAETGKMVEKMYAVRRGLKAAGHPAHKALKLVLNSLYGKLCQLVGHPRYTRFAAASFVTGLCRASIWRAMFPALTGPAAKTHPIVSVMTDGILSKVPLDLPVSEQLGEWELTTFDGVLQLMSGVYSLAKTGQPDTIRYRSFTRKFDPADAWAFLQRGETEINDKGNEELKKYAQPMRIFVSRLLALAQAKYAGLLYQFAEDLDGTPVEMCEFAKKTDFSLASKRRWTPRSFVKEPWQYHPVRRLNLRDCEPGKVTADGAPISTPHYNRHWVQDLGNSAQTLAEMLANPAPDALLEKHISRFEVTDGADSSDV